MVDIQTVSIAIASAGVLIAAIYYVLQIRNQTKLRQTDMVMRLYTIFGSTDFAKAIQKVDGIEFEDFDDYVKKYRSKHAADTEVNTGWFTVAIFFEGLGVLAKKRLIDMDLADDLFSTSVRLIWEKMSPVVKGMRELLKSPSYAEWFEYLYNEIKKREQKLQSKIDR